MGVRSPGEKAERLSGWSWLTAQEDGLFYPEVSIGDNVVAGQNLGRIADIFGETLQDVVCPASGEILFLVTSLAMNAEDPLMAIAY